MDETDSSCTCQREPRAGPGLAALIAEPLARHLAGSTPRRTRAGRAAVGARDPPLPHALSLRARPPASPPPAPPPAPPLRGARRGASRLQSPWRAGSHEPPALPGPGLLAPLRLACPRTSRSSLRRLPLLGGAAHGPAREPTSDAGPAGPRRPSGECRACGAGAARLGSGKTWGVRGARTWRPGLKTSAEPKVSRSWSRWSGEQGRRDPGFSHPPRLLPRPLGSASPETVFVVGLFLSFFFWPAVMRLSDA